MSTLTATIEVEVDPDWIEFCTQYNDIFMYDYCGYWMAGMEQDNQLGWLVYEYDWGGNCPMLKDVRESPEYENIVAAWRDGLELPEHWFRLSEDACKRAWVEGVKREGLNWYNDGDASSYDCALQRALLGEIIYG